MAHEKHTLIEDVVANVSAIVSSNIESNESKCDKCKRVLTAAKPAALFAPHKVPESMVHLCKSFAFAL